MTDFGQPRDGYIDMPAYTGHHFRGSDGLPYANVFIGGGAARYLCGKQWQKNDTDIFPLNERAFDAAVAWWRGRTVGGVPATTDWAVSFPQAHMGTTVQIIRPRRAYDCVEDVLDRFDLVNCRAAIIAPGVVRCDARVPDLEKRKVLEIGCLDYTLSLSARLQKNFRQGYTLPDAEWLRVLDWWRGAPEAVRQRTREYAEEKRRRAVAGEVAYALLGAAAGEEAEDMDEVPF